MCLGWWWRRGGGGGSAQCAPGSGLQTRTTPTRPHPHHVHNAGLNGLGAAEAVNAIVEDTTQCKFEATSPASDEVVLFNILQVCLH